MFRLHSQDQFLMIHLDWIPPARLWLQKKTIFPCPPASFPKSQSSLAKFFRGKPAPCFIGKPWKTHGKTHGKPMVSWQQRLMPEQRCGKVRIAHLGMVPPSRPFNGSSLFCSPSDPRSHSGAGCWCSKWRFQAQRHNLSLRRLRSCGGLRSYKLFIYPPMKTIELCTINPKKLSPKIAEAKSGHVWNIEALMSSRRLWRPTAKSCRQLPQQMARSNHRGF